MILFRDVEEKGGEEQLYIETPPRGIKPAGRSLFCLPIPNEIGGTAAFRTTGICGAVVIDACVPTFSATVHNVLVCNFLHFHFT